MFDPVIVDFVVDHWDQWSWCREKMERITFCAV